MSSTAPSSARSWPETALDGTSAGLFAGFVVLLFLGYLYPGFPYEGLSVLPLVLALATLLTANLRAERRARLSPGPGPR